MAEPPPVLTGRPPRIGGSQPHTNIVTELAKRLQRVLGSAVRREAEVNTTLVMVLFRSVGRIVLDWERALKEG